MYRFLTSLLVLFGLTTGAFAQATSIQQTNTRLDVATAVAYATAAQGVQATATVTVPGGQFAYITGVSMDVCANATGGTAITNANFTSTNIQSLPSWPISFAGTANTCGSRIIESWATPLKSLSPGVNVTVVSPAGSAQNIFSIRVYYYLAP